MTRTYRGTQLPSGPWDDEPDHVDFEAHGLPCILHRGGMGAWCGYVAVPPGHPWHGKGYTRIYDDGLGPDVHGGLTYSEHCAGDICHVAKPGEPDDVWWVGFDCNHHGDRSLGDVELAMTRPDLSGGGEYRNVDYAKNETIRLAEQVREASSRT